ncbi:MAG: class II aldolase/adducin family protein [Anaerolineae bacterium]|nr:class II aldolase/adducin family protein [Anaerolineae bacterium]
MPIFPGETELRDQICEIGRLMRQYNYIDGTSGNISARLDGNHILCTPSGLAKGHMTPDQLIVVNMDGEKVGEPTDANANLLPTSEILMHLECYLQRPDVNGVVHAHPTTAVALTAAGVSMERALLAEAVIMLGLVPTAPYATPCGTEDRNSIRGLIVDHDAVMLSHHGSLTVGADVWTAYLRLEVLEHYAEVLFKAKQLGLVRTLSAKDVDDLLALRRRYGYGLPKDDVLFHQYYAAAGMD